MRAFYRTLRDEQYDIVFDTQGLFKTSAILRMARLAPGGQRIGLANATEGSGYEPISRLFHSRSVPVGLHTHAVTRAREVAAAALGYAIDTPADFALRAPDASSAGWLPTQPYVVFFHGTARAAKRWDEGNWISLAQYLEPQGMPILLPWGNEDEKQIAHRLAAQMKHARVLSRLPMMEAVVLAQRAAFVVGVDTGLTHIAAAFNRPTIEIYADSPRWKTEGNWSDNIINLGDTGQVPGVEDVWQALQSLMARERQVV
jgi:heptosyltransferase-1